MKVTIYEVTQLNYYSTTQIQIRNFTQNKILTLKTYYILSNQFKFSSYVFQLSVLPIFALMFHTLKTDSHFFSLKRQLLQSSMIYYCVTFTSQTNIFCSTFELSIKWSIFASTFLMFSSRICFDCTTCVFCCLLFFFIYTSSVSLGSSTT